MNFDPITLAVIMSGLDSIADDMAYSVFRIARSDPHLVTINARCLDGVDPAELVIEPFDGRNWKQAMRAERGGAKHGAN